MFLTSLCSGLRAPIYGAPISNVLCVTSHTVCNTKLGRCLFVSLSTSWVSSDTISLILFVLLRSQVLIPLALFVLLLSQYRGSVDSDGEEKRKK
jgi:hypothetical protein